MRILVSGSSGLIGSRLVPSLKAGGHDVVRLVRGEASGNDEIHWDPQAETIDREALGGLDAVVHLAGASIAGLFLDRFVGEGLDWAHFDTFAWRPQAKPGRPKGGDAYGLRAAWHMLRDRFGRP